MATLKMCFDTKDDWDSQLFYKIYEKNNVKYIKIIAQTDRIATPNQCYLDWVITEYKDCIIPLNDFLQWDIYYQLTKLIDKSEALEYILEPNDAYEKANEYVKGEDNTGSDFKQLIYLTEFTPCGNYYGI